MGQHAVLHRNLQALTHIVEPVQQIGNACRRIGGRIDADHGITTTEQQAIQNGGGDTAWIVGGMIGLETDGQMTRQADGVAKPRNHRAFARHQNQILVAHQLADRGHHFRSQAGGQRRQRLRIGGRVEQGFT